MMDDLQSRIAFDRHAYRPSAVTGGTAGAATVNADELADILARDKAHGGAGRLAGVGDQTHAERLAALEKKFAACVLQEKINHVHEIEARGRRMLLLYDGRFWWWRNARRGYVRRGPHKSRAEAQAAAEANAAKYPANRPIMRLGVDGWRLLNCGPVQTFKKRADAETALQPHLAAWQAAMGQQEQRRA